MEPPTMPAVVLEITPQPVRSNGNGDSDNNLSNDFSAPHWTASVRCFCYKDGEIGSTALKIHNNTLASTDARRDLRWFMEDHATRDPFDVTRANAVRRKLKEFELELAKDVVNANVLPSKRGSHLSISIQVLPGLDHALYALPWEALEDPVAWAFAGVFYKSYSIERVLCPQVPVSTIQDAVIKQDEEQRQYSKTNILVMSARPESVEGSAADLISVPIAKIVSKYPGMSRKATLHIARPGTWKALVRTLQAKPKGFYQFVHIDMHGQVENDEYSLNFVKLTAKRRARAHKVPAKEIADLLIEHGIRVVTMNACESAKVLDSGSLAANMASVLVQKGIQAVVATSFRAMDSTMELFISFLYLKLLAYDLDLHDSVALARKELLNQPDRKATLGRKVNLMDYIVPVVYRRQDIDTHDIRIKGPEVPSVAEMPMEDAWDYMNGFMEFIAPIELIGRDQEISLVETLLEICPIVLLHGEGGIGKSALLRHFQWWWTATGLVQWVVHLDFADTPAPCLTLQDLKDIMVKRMSGFEGFLGDGESADAKNIIKFFLSNSCLLVLDSLDILTTPVDTSKPKMSTAEQKKVQRFLEDLIQSDGTSSSDANSYVLLASRSCNVFTWDTMEEIAGYKITGLPIIHCLTLGWRAASRYTRSQPNFGNTGQDTDHLERIAEVVHGNPLAIQLIFPVIVDPGVTPRVLFDTVLTGAFSMEENPKPWSHFRFSLLHP